MYSRYHRVSQPPSSFPNLTAPAASSSRSSWSQPRPDPSAVHISPQSSRQAQQSARLGGPSSQSSQLNASFRDGGLAADGSGPSQVSGPSNHDRSLSSVSPANHPSSFNLFASQQTRYFTSDGQPLIPFTNLPVPSKAQIHSYLVKYMSLPEEHQSSWSIDGHSFDSHMLFNLVVQMGGSHRVGQWDLEAPGLPLTSPQITSYDAWPHVAAMFGFPIFRETPQGPRSSPDIGSQLRKMFLTYLGGLEALWDKTKAADSLMSMDQAASQESARSLATSQQRQSQASSSTTLQYGHQPRTAYSTLQSQSSAAPRNTTSSHRLHGAQPSLTARLQHPAPSQPSVKSIAGLLSGPPRPPVPMYKAGPSAQSTMPTQPPTATARILSPPKIPANPSYDPPSVDTFEHLVQRNLLPLPDLGSPVHIPPISNAVSYYAWRAHELRIEIRKMTVNEIRRHLSMEELMFWSKLCGSLRGKHGA